MEPYLFTYGKRKRFLDLLAKGHRRGQALAQIGLTRRVLHDWCKDHPEYKEEMEEAELSVNELVEAALLTKITKELHYPSIMSWLYNNSPDKWKDRRQVNNTTNAPFDFVVQQAILQDPKLLDAALSKLYGTPDTPSPCEAESTQLPDNTTPPSA